MSKASRVLVVDDDEMQRESLAAILAADAIAVTQCERATDALELIRSQLPFDLVVADIVMPGMGGLEFCTRAREMRPALPVVLLTGDRSVIDMVIARGNVALLKPYSAVTLKHVLDEHLGRD